jgi:hypothetical protein
MNIGNATRTRPDEITSIPSADRRDWIWEVEATAGF